MIWTKTAIGRAEIGARALVHERARRNLLLLIDGVRSQDALLGSVAGIGPGDFDQLARLGLIAHGPAATATPSHLVAGDERPAAPGYGQLTTRLTQLISSELGLRGFRLTLAVEKAADARALAPVAWQVLAEIAKRKGDEAAERARRSLYGT
jgi:hypothetical protein